MIIKIELDTSSYDLIDPVTTSHQIISKAIDKMHSSVGWPLYGRIPESFKLTNEFGGVTTVVGTLKVTDTVTTSHQIISKAIDKMHRSVR